MYLPKNVCTVTKASEEFDVYGKPIPGVSFKERCAIVAIVEKDEKTSVRSDSSASRGNSHEMLFDAVILFGPKTKTKIHDIVKINGYALEVMAQQPRYDIDGVIDHYQNELKIWIENEVTA